MKDKCDIEAVLDWAYRVQCVDRRVDPRRRRRGPSLWPSAAPFASCAALGTKVSSGGFHPGDVMADVSDDASIIHDAVLGLDEYWLEWRSGYEVALWSKPLVAEAGLRLENTQGEWWLVGTDPTQRWRLEQVGVSVLLILTAKLGGRPEWHEGWQPQQGEVRGRVGQPRRRSRINGVALESEVHHARAVYCCWHAALGLLAQRLVGTLRGFDVQGPEAESQPWSKPPKRVLRAV